MTDLQCHEDAWMAGWNARQHEVDDAFDEGVRAAQKDRNERWASYSAQLSATASTPPADVLADLRGQHDRAQRIRDFWALTGLHEPRPPATPVDPALRERFIQRCRDSWARPSDGQVAA